MYRRKRGDAGSGPAEPEVSVLYAEPVVRRKKRRTSDTIDRTWLLVQEGLSIDQIAHRRGLTSATILGHIEYLLDSGKPVDIDRFVPPDTQLRLRRLLQTLNTPSLRDIVEAAGGGIGYDEVRLVRAAMSAEEGGGHDTAGG